MRHGFYPSDRCVADVLLDLLLETVRIEPLADLLDGLPHPLARLVYLGADDRRIARTNRDVISHDRGVRPLGHHSSFRQCQLVAAERAP
jgi:hypothetical protein